MTGNEWFIIGAAAVIGIGYAGYSFYARKKSFNEFLAQKEKRRTDPPISVPKAAPVPKPTAAPAHVPVQAKPLSKEEQARVARFNETQRRLDRGALSDTLEDEVQVLRQRSFVPPVYAEPTVYDRTPLACSKPSQLASSKPSRSDIDDSHSHRSCSSSSSSYGGGDSGSSSSSSSCSSSSSSSDSGSSGCD